MTKKITVSGKELIDFTLYLWNNNYDDQEINKDTILDLIFKGYVGRYNETDENKREFFMNEFDVRGVKIVSPDQFEIEYNDEEWDYEWYIKKSNQMRDSLNNEWWNNLDKNWKEELVSNLLNSPKYQNNKNLHKSIPDLLKEPDKIISDIINMKRLHISEKLIYNLSPALYLKNLNDFHISESSATEYYSHSLIKIYPKQLRSKVKRLQLNHFRMNDLTSLSDFINLEELYIQCCRLISLVGIEKLTKLKKLTADQGNFYSDLNPLRGLNLTHLEMEFTKVSDLSPLLEVPSLEWINLYYLKKIDDLTPLLNMPNLKEVRMPHGGEIPANELASYIRKKTKKDILPRIHPKEVTVPNSDKIPENELDVIRDKEAKEDIMPPMPTEPPADLGFPDDDLPF